MDKRFDIVILGAGESGIGAAKLAVHLERSVLVSDLGVIDTEDKVKLQQIHVPFEEGKHTKNLIQNAKLIIKSPGIPDTAPPVQWAMDSSVEVISEIEFAFRYMDKGATVVGITGSNGKTTTTLLLQHILRKGGLEAKAVGNVGYSFAAAVAEEVYTHYVVEVSSFQLDNSPTFAPDIAVLLNITPDHLDRYEYSMEKYAFSKSGIYRHQNNKQQLIFNLDDPVIEELLGRVPASANLLPFSMEKVLPNGAYATKEHLIITLNNQLNMSIHDLALKGKHNTQNSLAAGLAARVLEIRKESVRESLTDFQNVEHRLEFVAKVHGIEFINDSKATNVNSTWYALESLTAPTVWIVGGVDKGNDYSILTELVSDNVESIICLGDDNSKIMDAFDGEVENIAEAKSMEEAVRLSYQFAKKGHTVLLSPACASFDLFENYEDRGNQFKRSVRNL